VYDLNDFPGLPDAKSQATSSSSSHKHQNPTISNSVSSDDLNTDTTKTSSQLPNNIYLPALKEEIKKNLLEEYNSILQQELAAFHAI